MMLLSMMPWPRWASAWPTLAEGNDATMAAPADLSSSGRCATPGFRNAERFVRMISRGVSGASPVTSRSMPGTSSGAPPVMSMA